MKHLYFSLGLLLAGNLAHAQTSHLLDRAHLVPGVRATNSVHLAVGANRHTYAFDRTNQTVSLSTDPRVPRTVLDADFNAQSSLFFLADFDERGAYVKHHVFDSPGNHSPRHLLHDGAGALYVVVEFADRLNYGAQPGQRLLEAPGKQLALVKLSEDLTPVLAKALPTDIFVKALSINASGEVLITSEKEVLRLDAKTFDVVARAQLPGFYVRTEAIHLNDDGTYLVGGAIRDRLTAIDTVIAGTRVQLAAGRGFIENGITFRMTPGGVITQVYYLPTDPSQRVSSVVELANGQVYVAGQRAVTSSVSGAFITSYSATGERLKSYGSTGARATIRSYGDTALLMDVPSTGQWFELGTQKNVEYNIVSKTGDMGFVHVLGDDLRPIERHSLPSTRVISVLPNGDFATRAVGIPGNNVVDPEGTLPYVLNWNGSGEGHYVAHYTRTCTPVSSATATPYVRTCTGGAYFDGVAEGTGLRYQWYDAKGQRLNDSRLEDFRFVIRGSSTPLLYRNVYLPVGYGVNTYILKIADGCGNVVEASDSSRYVLLGQPTEPRGLGADLVRPLGAEVEITAGVSLNFPDSLLDYQWYRGGFALRESQKFAGVATPTLTIRDLDFDDDGRYSAEIWTKGCDANNRTARWRGLRVEGYEVLQSGGQHATEQLVMWPNPGPGPVSVGNPSADAIRGDLHVVDVYGRRQLSLSNVDIPAGDALPLATRDLPDGQYFLQLSTAQGLVSRSFIINRRP